MIDSIRPIVPRMVAVLLVVWASSGDAASFDDPEWPCIQRKVPELSIGQMWAGPPIDDTIRALGEDQAVQELAARLAYRRTTPEEAEALVTAFATSLAGDRNAVLSAVFAETFDQISTRRSQVMSGIARYAKKQSGISDHIEEMRKTLATLEAAAEPDYDRIEETQDNLTWETRIFQDRQQSLTYVCETPVLLEQRAFSIARIIMGQLSE